MRPPKYFPGLFLNRYPSLRGKGWIKSLPAEDLRVFVDIGARSHNHGRMGGQALARDREHMAAIGRRGAVMTNVLKWWKRRVKEETEKELGIILDY